ILNKFLLCRWKFRADVLVPFFCNCPATGSTFEKPQLHQIGFMYLLYSVFFFRKRGRDRFEADWATVEFFNDNVQNIAISLIQATLINFQKRQRLFYRLNVKQLFIHSREITSTF